MFGLFRSFMAVYETRSFSLAATRVFVSQPTISHHIAELERQLNAPLFIRTKKHPPVPTPAADVLYAFAGKMLAEWAETQATIQAGDAPAPWTVRFGLSQSIATVLFPTVAKALHRAFPALTYDVSVSNSATVVRELEGHKIDFGFVEQPLLLAGTERISLSADQLVVAGVETGTWLVRENGSGINHYTYQYWHEQGLTPAHQMVVNANHLLLQLVQDGVGQAVMSDRIVPKGVPVAPMGPRYLRQFYLLSPTAQQTPQHQALIDCITEAAATIA